MATVQQDRPNYIYGNKEHRSTSPTPHFSYETYYKHQEKQPAHTNSLLQYLSDTELKFRNDNLYESELTRLPRRTDILNRYVKMNPNFEHLNRVYEPNLTNIEKQRYRRCVEQQQQKINLTRKKFDFQTADGHNSHYFLTGARYNRFDTVDSKILLKYGTFVNRNNPEQVEIKPSHFKKFREILQTQQRSSSNGMDSARHDFEFQLSGQRSQEEDLEDLTNRYERSSSRQSNLKQTSRPNRLPKLNDPTRYIDVASQMPERKRGRRSVDRAISSSSTHRSNRHHRQSQHQQQQQQQQQQNSVSYVANKVSFSLAEETNPPVTIVPALTIDKQNDDEEELITRNHDHQEHHHSHRHQHIIPHKIIQVDEDNDVDDERTDENVEHNLEEDPIVVEQIREQANHMISDILSSAMYQITLSSKE